MIDYKALNSLIFTWCAVGIMLIVMFIILGVIIGTYYLMKINKLDYDNFKKRVKEVLDDGSFNSKK